jgi:hypothetical protein
MSRGSGHGFCTSCSVLPPRPGIPEMHHRRVGRLRGREDICAHIDEARLSAASTVEQPPV